MTTRHLLALATALAVLGVAGCTTGDPALAPKQAAPAHSPARNAEPPDPSAATVTATPPPEPHPVSLPAMFGAEFTGRNLEFGDVLERNAAYTRYAVTYTSDELTISGIMNIPTGDGPFPVLVLAHGYIDPAVYTTGRGLAREQDYLARQGYAVLHTDYRNHAGSDDDPGNEERLRLGYTADVINAVLAVRESDHPQLDGDRIGLLGRSMGGGVTYNVLVTAPGLVDAAVVYAPVSSAATDNFERWMRDSPVADRILGAYGSQAEAPDFWRNISPRTFFDRITEPVLMFHGTADESCPIEWSRETYDGLVSAGVDAELVVYEGEQHAFGPRWQESIERTSEFFAAHLG